MTNLRRNSLKLSFFPGHFESTKYLKNYEETQKKQFAGNYFRNNFVSEGRGMRHLSGNAEGSRNPGNKVPWKTGIPIYLHVTSRPLIFLQKEAILPPCNFATTHLAACILNFYLPLTLRPMKWRTLSQCPNLCGKSAHARIASLVRHLLVTKKRTPPFGSAPFRSAPFVSQRKFAGMATSTKGVKWFLLLAVGAFWLTVSFGTWTLPKPTVSNQGTFDHDKGQEICNFGAPSPLDFLVEFSPVDFFLFLQVFFSPVDFCPCSPGFMSNY